MSVSRRDVLKVGAALSSLAVFGVGYSQTLKGIAQGWWAGDKPDDRLAGNAPEPEFHVDRETGEVVANPRQYLANTICVGCTSLCGVRVRVDRQSGKVLRVSGNPYHVLSADPYVPFQTPILDSYRATSAYAESGLGLRATTCGRGNAVLDKLTDPYRVLAPLKRSGPRGSGQWEPISFEQLITEIVEGGDLFGEGQVDGLRAIHDLETPIDPQAPELGPRANGLAFLAGFKEGRIDLAQRFVLNAFGSPNFSGHRGNCGLSMRAGYAALLNDLNGQPHLKPDFQNVEFILNIGTAPGNAGNPFKRQAKLVAEGRSAGRLKSVVVDPVLTNADNQASGEYSRWVPVIPGTDGALAMGMIRWILENERYNAAFLSQPNPASAEAAGEASWSNATHLVIVTPGSELEGRFLRGSHLAGVEPEDPAKDPFIVVSAGGQLAPHTDPGPAELFYSGQVEIDGQPVQLKTSLQLLLEESQRFSLAEDSQACGVPEETIVDLAKEFTSHGRKAVADCHGGTMSSNGFYNAYAIVMLNALVGNLNWKGGASVGGGTFPAVSDGPRYNLVDFPGKVKPSGVRISRRGFAFEKTSEFKRRKATGENPYPAPAPWYPYAAALQSEFIPSALNGYPYPLKALFLWNTNPLYGQSGLYEAAKEALADPQRIPLIVSIDPFINESSAFADYIIPDTVLYESWGAAAPWAGTLTKVSSLRWPAVDAPLAKAPNGDPICMESFLIALAQRLDLPGFGPQAISDAGGSTYPLERLADWHLRAAANVAFAGEPVPDIADEEIELTGLDRIFSEIRATLKPDEHKRVAFVLARGGRFDPAEKAYQGEWLAKRYPEAMQIYNEAFGTSRNSLTGERFKGLPTWQPPVFANGELIEKRYNRIDWPFVAVSTKSQYMSASVIGAERLHAIQPSNAFLIQAEDARWLGIQSGDRVRVTSPGASLEGIAYVRHGLQKGVIGIEHGYGHWGLGAQTDHVDNQVWHASAARAAGVAINRLGISDPSRQGLSTLADLVVGSNARQALPVRVEKLG